MGKFVNFEWKGSKQKGKTHKKCLICGANYMGKPEEDTCGSDQCEYAYARARYIESMNKPKEEK